MGRHYTSREFNQDIAGAKRAAEDGPVIVSSRGKPSHVLVSWSEWQRRTGEPATLADLLSYPGLEDVDVDALVEPRKTEPAFSFDDDADGTR